MFANNFLPTGFGGDAARALVIAPAAPSTGRAVASVFVDRVTALACLVLLAWFAVAVEPDSVPGSLIGLLAFATALGLAGALALAFLARRSHRATHATFLQRLIAPLALMWVEIRDRGKLRSVALRTTTLGLAYQATMVLASWVLARAIDLDLSFALLAVVTPLVILVTLFPISIAGLGVREGGYVTLLAEAGVSAPDATLLSLLTVAALAIATLPGAVGLLLPAVTQHDRRDPAPS
jgi:uncharacterized membrane protein YbhN (UPF0104 family)